MFKKCLLCAFVLLVYVSGCGSSDRISFVMGDQEKWQLEEGAVKVDGGLLLRAVAGKFALATVPVDVRGNEQYQVVVELRSTGLAPSSLVHVDLWGEGYDSDEQEIFIAPVQVQKTFSRLTNVLLTKNAPSKVLLRLFTDSSNGVFVKSVELTRIKE